MTVDDTTRPGNDDDAYDVVKLYAAGLSIRQVAARVSMSYGYVRGELVSRGVTLRRRGGANNPGVQVAPRRTDNWLAYFAAVRDFVNANGHARLPTDYRVNWVGNVYMWLHNQRRYHRAGTLSADRVAALTQLGVDLGAPTRVRGARR